MATPTTDHVARAHASVDDAVRELEAVLPRLEQLERGAVLQLRAELVSARRRLRNLGLLARGGRG